MGIFTYQAWNVFKEYSEKKTLLDTKFIKQDKYPLPLICISTHYDYDSFNNTFNITYEDIIKGKWKVDGLSERELWDFLSPTLPNLIKEIKVYKILEKDSEKYSKIRISVENLLSFGVDIERKDYHSLPKIFCLSFRNINVSFSITLKATFF